MAQTAYAYCLPRKPVLFAIVFFGSGLLLTLNLVSRSSVTHLDNEGKLQANLAVMQTRLKFLESQFGGKQEEIIKLQGKIQAENNPSTVDVPKATYSPELEALLKNISGSKASDALCASEKMEAINTPFSLRLMPHLVENPKSLRPAYHLKSGRQYADYIIGIPHVKRDVDTYLYGTIKFLLKNMDEEDKNNTIIVVMVGETDLAYVVQVAHNIEQWFEEDFERGMIEVVAPNEFYYPNLDSLPSTLNDSPKRVKWRTKQNLDAIYLMGFVESRCMYYLMIEDDVVASERFMKHIYDYTTATTVSSPDWFFIQYSTTGGIGKLFRTTDLLHFMTYVQLFYYNMPIDWLTESYLADRACGINKSSKECGEAKSKIRPTYKKNLFKHVGLFSSLKGKIQKVKDAEGHTSPPYFPHLKNPELVQIICSLQPRGENTIEAAYRGDTFFWGTTPKKGDVIEFWFKYPTEMARYLIRSGNHVHTTDKIYDAVLEILPRVSKEKDFIKIATFDEFGLVDGMMENKYGEIRAIRVVFTKPSKYWVLISEVEFVTLETFLAMHKGRRPRHGQRYF